MKNDERIQVDPPTSSLVKKEERDQDAPEIPIEPGLRLSGVLFDPMRTSCKKNYRGYQTYRLAWVAELRDALAVDGKRVVGPPLFRCVHDICCFFRLGM